MASPCAVWPEQLIRAIVALVLEDEPPGQRLLSAMSLCGVSAHWRAVARELPPLLLAFDGAEGGGGPGPKATSSRFRRAPLAVKRALFSGAARLLHGAHARCSGAPCRRALLVFHYPISSRIAAACTRGAAPGRTLPRPTLPSVSPSVAAHFVGGAASELLFMRGCNQNSSDNRDFAGSREVTVPLLLLPACLACACVWACPCSCPCPARACCYRRLL